MRTNITRVIDTYEIELEVETGDWYVVAFRRFEDEPLYFPEILLPKGCTDSRDIDKYVSMYKYGR